MLLKNGDNAPTFKLPDADMETVDLASFLDKEHLVLLFYPKDGTPSCTREVTDFSDHESDFRKQGCTILGINREDCLKHQEFRDKEGIGINLLSDTDGEVCQQYGVWQSKEVDGVQKMGIVRSTFIIDRSGVIRHALYNVNFKGHAQEILALVKELNS
jgi:thioredoxin-dependent peroxiredoxin